ncbi:MAG: bifunctional riboflavin kinase/FAD synthetase [Alphaproteobacteria bacterium]|nr:MAG: bifunctional riboflavin kinase/FAD synthetase [Alphaproteobacteria bacterium]
MKIIRQYSDIAPEDRGAVVALGNFDGVHQGHRAVIRRAAMEAKKLGVPLGVIVFEPHPREFFAPNAAPFRLSLLPVKAKLLEGEGVDILYALPFDEALAGKHAADFIQDVLIDGLGILHVVTGYDFRFGAGRSGDTTLLSYMGAEEGIGVSIVAPVSMQSINAADNDDEVFSSTRIRQSLRDGRPAEAARLLGHYWSLQGTVEKGDQRGRTIGFPTANIRLDRLLKPATGVYAVQVEVIEGPLKGVYDGVANYGNRPTFDKKDTLLEVHLFNFEGDLYGQTIEVSFIDFIRPERKFDGLEALRAQIEADSVTAREIISGMRESA